MVKKYLFVFILVMVSIFILTYLSGNQLSNLFSSEFISKPLLSSDDSLSKSSKEDLFKKIKVGGKELTVEVVTSELDVKNGLSNRDKIGSDGMLFVFNQEQRLAFWMKEMRFSLDMIWINSGKVTEITRDVPYPQLNDLSNKNDSRLLLYSPQKVVDQVLEVNAGDSDRLGIQVGDEVSFMPL